MLLQCCFAQRCDWAACLLWPRAMQVAMLERPRWAYKLPYRSLDNPVLCSGLRSPWCQKPLIRQSPEKSGFWGVCLLKRAPNGPNRGFLTFRLFVRNLIKLIGGLMDHPDAWCVERRWFFLYYKHIDILLFLDAYRAMSGICYTRWIWHYISLWGVYIYYMYVLFFLVWTYPLLTKG